MDDDDDDDVHKNEKHSCAAFKQGRKSFDSNSFYRVEHTRPVCLHTRVHARTSCSRLALPAFVSEVAFRHA